ncbi:MAG: hypothetical protein KA716_28330, partial [Gloeotrichia echinulata DEX184]|nr:hypothetical protein [Gloeotrichia echinulata DEX184]
MIFILYDIVGARYELPSTATAIKKTAISTTAVKGITISRPAMKRTTIWTLADNISNIATNISTVNTAVHI